MPMGILCSQHLIMLIGVKATVSIVRRKAKRLVMLLLFSTDR